jgi:phytanoyl-CoA hydroxylase
MIYKNVKKKLDSRGWIVIKNFLSKKEINKYKKIIYNFLKKNHLKYKGRYINYAENSRDFKKINSFHKLEACTSVKKFFNKSKINNLSYHLLGDLAPELRASELFNKPKFCGLKASPHQDDYYWNVKNNRGMTMWIALDKADRSNGSVYYYTGSHKKGLLPHKASFGKGTSQTIANETIFKKFKKEYVKLNEGDLVVHNSLVIHGSDENKSRNSRAGWTFAIKPKKLPYDKKRTARFLKSLNYQIKLREKNARV